MQKSILIEEIQLEPIDDSKASYHDMKWKQWEAEMCKTHSPKGLDVISSLPSILTDPVDGNNMVKEGGMWKNQVFGSVFLCKNVLFELVENTLKPVLCSDQEPARKSPVSGKPMLKYSSSLVPGLIIDKCAESGGFYFDGGELTKLQSFEFHNLLKEDEEYQEFREGLTVSRSRHRWASLGAPLAPGFDGTSLNHKFRTAVFFKNPLGAGLSVSSIGWLIWILGRIGLGSRGMQTGDQNFDPLFAVNAENEELVQFILDHEIRNDILELSKMTLYGESGDMTEIEITDQYISIVEGPYVGYYVNLKTVLEGKPFEATPIGQESQNRHFDKTEEVLARLVSLAKKIEHRVSKFS